jgi:hypothetical protein
MLKPVVNIITTVLLKPEVDRSAQICCIEQNAVSCESDDTVLKLFDVSHNTSCLPLGSVFGHVRTQRHLPYDSRPTAAGSVGDAIQFCDSDSRTAKKSYDIFPYDRCRV